MKKLVIFSSKKSFVPAIISVCFLLSLGVVLGTRNLPQTSPQKLVWKKPIQQYENPNDKRTLKEKAQEVGHYRAVQPPPDLNGYGTLDDLTLKAELIVIARARHNISQVSNDGATVTMNYEMQSEYFYKGRMAQGNLLSVILPGGLAVFSDGTSAEIGAPWFKKMINGNTYLLFLNRQDNGLWITTGGPRGVFSIPTSSTNRKVASHSLIEGDPMARFNDMGVVEFLRTVKHSVESAR
jgi:hypothetical protein